MKKGVLSVLLATCFAVAFAPSTNAQDFFETVGIKAGSYAGYEAGARLLKLEDVEDEPGVELDVDPGFFNSIFFGYADGRGWRGEIVGSFGRNNYKATIRRSGGVTYRINSAAWDIWTAMTRVFYDLNPSGQMKPFLGAGVGWSRIETSARFPGTASTSTTSGNYFTWTGIAGFRLKAGQNLSIGAQYGFVGYGDSNISHDTIISFSYDL